MPQKGKSMAQGPSGRSEWFERELIRDGERWLIRSRCRTCGAVIVGSVTEGLTGDEEEHIERCHTDRQSRAG